MRRKRPGRPLYRAGARRDDRSMAEVPVGTDELPPYLVEPEDRSTAPTERARATVGRPCPTVWWCWVERPTSCRSGWPPRRAVPRPWAATRRAAASSSTSRTWSWRRPRPRRPSTSGWRPERSRPHPEEPAPASPIRLDHRGCGRSGPARAAPLPVPPGRAGAGRLGRVALLTLHGAPLRLGRRPAPPHPPLRRRPRHDGPHRPPPPTLAGDDGPPPYHDRPCALVVYAHPSPDSLTHALYEAATAALAAADTRSSGSTSTPRSWRRPCPRRSGGPTIRTSPSSTRPWPATRSARPMGRRWSSCTRRGGWGFRPSEGLAGAGAGARRAFHLDPVTNRGSRPRRGASGRRRHDLRIVAGRPPRARRRPADAAARAAHAVRRRCRTAWLALHSVDAATPGERAWFIARVEQRLSWPERGVRCSSSRLTRAGQLRGRGAGRRPPRLRRAVTTSTTWTSTPRASSPPHPRGVGRATGGPASRRTGRRVAVIRCRPTSPPTPLAAAPTRCPRLPDVVGRPAGDHEGLARPRLWAEGVAFTFRPDGCRTRHELRRIRHLVAITTHGSPKRSTPSKESPASAWCCGSCGRRAIRGCGPVGSPATASTSPTRPAGAASSSTSSGR